jgi:hypothetical protein
MTDEEIDLHREAMRREDRLIPSCKRCRYWEPTSPQEEMGSCVRRAPVALGSKGGEAVFAVFPVTAPDHRCGEFLTAWPGSVDPDETSALNRIADAMAGMIELTDSLCGAIRGLREDLAQ